MSSQKLETIKEQVEQNTADYSQMIQLGKLFQPAFNVVWNAIAPYVIGRDSRGDTPASLYDELFLQGGRASGKSYFASVIVWLALESDPKKNGVIIRKVGSSIRKSCWKQMMKVRKRLELYHWKPNKTELTFTNELTGQQIFFVGLDDEEKVRSITVESGYLSIAWFEEAKQFSSMEEIDQAVASILRGGADDDEKDYEAEDEGEQEYLTILTYNPPKSNSDWINIEARNRDKKTRLSHKSTYLTMPKAWLGAKILSEIEQMKVNKPKQYAHMYLGKVTGTGGEYFDNIEVRHVSEEEIAKFDYFNMGIDFGKKDPNVWMKTYIDTDNGIGYVIDGIYQKDWDTDSPKNKYEQFAELILPHIKDCPDDTIWCDLAGDAQMSILSGSPYNLACEPAPKQGVNGRDAGGLFLQSLKKIIINDIVPEEIREELLNFESMQRAGGAGWIDKPGKKKDHSFDCLRYSENEAIADGCVSSGYCKDEDDEEE